MFNIHVERIINADIEDVFAVLTDHANYENFRGVDKSVLVEQGDEATNGLGAIREISAAGQVLKEKIVGYEYPIRFEYKIIESSPLPYEHLMGIVELSREAEGTKVVWRSRGRIKIPILGKLFFDKQVQSKGGRAFGSILKQVEMATLRSPSEQQDIDQAS